MTSIIPEKEYDELHSQNLVPLDINIDVESFLDDIKVFYSFRSLNWLAIIALSLSRTGIPLIIG